MSKGILYISGPQFVFVERAAGVIEMETSHNKPVSGIEVRSDREENRMNDNEYDCLLLSATAEPVASNRIPSLIYLLRWLGFLQLYIY